MLLEWLLMLLGGLHALAHLVKGYGIDLATCVALAQNFHRRGLLRLIWLVCRLLRGCECSLAEEEVRSLIPCEQANESQDQQDEQGDPEQGAHKAKNHKEKEWKGMHCILSFLEVKRSACTIGCIKMHWNLFTIYRIS